MFHSDPRIDVLMYLVHQEVLEGRTTLPPVIKDEVEKQMLCLGLTRHQAENFVIEEMLDSHMGNLFTDLIYKHNPRIRMN